MAISVVGCATSTGVVPIGNDSYMLSRSGGWGSSNAGHVLADAYKEANEYCQESGKKMLPTGSQTAPLSFAHEPEAQLNFLCLDPKDSRLSDVTMVPVKPTDAGNLSPRAPSSN